MESKLDLNTVNNFLVKLRKPIDRSRQHIISKMTRHAAHLKGKKGTKEQILANERKVERLRKEIQIMSKLPKNSVAKFAILNTQKCFQETINPEAMSEDEIDLKLTKRALLRISNHSLIDKELSVFRSEHPTWAKELDEILSILGEKSREKRELKKQNMRMLERKNRKKFKSASKKDKNFELPECPGEDGSDDEKAFVSSLRALIKKTSKKSGRVQEDEGSGTNSESEEEEDSDGEVPEEQDRKSNGSNHKGKYVKRENIPIDEDIGDSESSEDEDSDDHEQEPEHNVVPDLKKKKDSKILGHRGKDLKRKDNELVIKPILMTEDSDDSDSSEDSDSDEESLGLDKQTANVSTIKDSFFLGGVSESESENSDQDVQKGSQNNKKDNNKPFPKEVPRQQGRGGGGDRSTSGRGRGMAKYSGPSRDERPLHPSWQAKRGHPSSITTYNGKKTKFSEDGDAVQASKYRKPEPQNPPGNIHPSWAAKQSQKKAIVPFQGTKLKFGENDIDKPRVAGLQGPTVHPSWSAKQNQKVGIQSFQGKKTVFNKS